MSFFNSKNKPSLTLSISFKSSSIDFQLINTTEQKTKEILITERKIIFLENSQDPQLYTSQCISELASLFERNKIKLTQLVQNTSLQVQIILYAPWFTSTIISINQIEPAIIDNNFLAKKLSNLKTDKQLHNLEKRVIKIQSNGYTLSEFTKTKRSNIFLNVYTSYISENIHKSLIDVFKKYIPHTKDIQYTTSPLLILDNVKRFMVKEDNITFLYIGGEITELGVIEDDSLIYYATFPIGKHDFLRELQNQVKTYDYDMLYQKQIEYKSAKQQEQFDLLKEKWSLSVLQTLELLNRNIPTKILIISDTKTKAFFTEILLNTIKENPSTILKNNRIINFDISLLKDIISYKTPTGEDELDLKLEALI